MSKMKQLNELITEMEGTANYFQNLIEEFKKLLSTEEIPHKQTVEQEFEKVIAMEDVRKVLATKAAAGYKQEVKDLLKAYEADKLTQLAPEHYAAVLEEAGGIGYD